MKEEKEKLICPGGIKVISIIFIILGSIHFIGYLLTQIIADFLIFAGGFLEASVGYYLLSVYALVVSILFLSSGVGLWKMKKWGIGLYLTLYVFSIPVIISLTFFHKEPIYLIGILLLSLFLFFLWKNKEKFSYRFSPLSYGFTLAIISGIFIGGLLIASAEYLKYLLP